MVRWPIRAICYVLEMRCLLVASQESQASASIHKFRFPLFFIQFLNIPVFLISMNLVTFFFPSFRLVVFVFSPIQSYIWVWITFFKFCFETRQCPQHCYFNPDLSFRARCQDFDLYICLSDEKGASIKSALLWYHSILLKILFFPLFNTITLKQKGRLLFISHSKIKPCKAVVMLMI